MNALSRCFLLVALGVFATQALAETYIYPKEGQSAEQQETDEGECYIWARDQSGYDPANPPVTGTAQAPEAQRGGGLRGAAVGAVAGEIIDDDASTGAAAGAVLGGARQRRQNKQAQQQAQSQNSEQQAQVEAMAAEYQKANKVCLEGRGYSVSD